MCLGRLAEIEGKISEEAIIYEGPDYTVDKRKLFTFDSENQQGNVLNVRIFLEEGFNRSAKRA
ncbi:hypothetical protein SAMN05660226_01243 [Parapedobacter luteus]|uniref:Uncharacterized protein n=2 Tax=Parapedobacter luteus TaxID=623280 RepID=A0A1T5B0U4_9SPHI|nr:hypothetical protein SAMN05660226_01243 [Parapedobacter luteus]